MPMVWRQSLNLLSKEAKSLERNQLERAGKRRQRKATMPQVRPSSTVTLQQDNSDILFSLDQTVVFDLALYDSVTLHDLT